MNTHARLGANRSRVQLVVLATGVSALAVMPAFLLGTLAVQLGRDLGIGPATLGLLISVFFGFTAASSGLLGGAFQDWGLRKGLTVSLAINAAAFAGIFASRTITHLFVAVAVAGIANGGIHPAANALLAEGVGNRLGLALGIKQAAPPSATVFGGLAVPAIALTIGWRSTFGVAAVLTVIGLVAVRRLVADKPARARRAAKAAVPVRFPIGAFRVIVLATGVGAAGSTALGIFLVDSGVQFTGIGEINAGLIAACTGLSLAVTRVALGWAIDVRGFSRPLHLAGVTAIVGAAGVLAVSSTTPLVFVAGAFFGYAVGWMWPLFVHVAVIEHSRANAARATGKMLGGLALGAALGPFVLGRIADTFTYGALWRTAAALNVCAGALFVVAERLVARSTAAQAGSAQGSG